MRVARAAAVGREAAGGAQAHLLPVARGVVHRGKGGSRAQRGSFPARENGVRRRVLVQAQQEDVGRRVVVEKRRATGDLHVARTRAARAAARAIEEPMRGERAGRGLGADAVVGRVEVRRDGAGGGVEERAGTVEGAGGHAVREGHARHGAAGALEGGVGGRAADDVDLAELRVALALCERFQVPVARAGEEVRDPGDAQGHVARRHVGGIDLDDGPFALEHRAPVGGAHGLDVGGRERAVDRAGVRGARETQLDPIRQPAGLEFHAQRPGPRGCDLPLGREAAARDGLPAKSGCRAPAPPRARCGRRRSAAAC